MRFSGKKIDGGMLTDMLEQWLPETLGSWVPGAEVTRLRLQREHPLRLEFECYTGRAGTGRVHCILTQEEEALRVDVLYTEKGHPAVQTANIPYRLLSSRKPGYDSLPAVNAKEFFTRLAAAITKAEFSSAEQAIMAARAQKAQTISEYQMAANF